MVHTSYNPTDTNRPESSSTGRDAHSVGAELKGGQHTAAETARTGMSEINQGAHHLVDAAKEQLHNTKEVATEKALEAKHAAEDGYESLKHSIRHNPMASVGIAAGVGILIGMVLCRSRS